MWIYRDKISGKGKGEATVTYDDPPTATSAIQWFNGKDFHGKAITVQLAERRSGFDGAARGGFGGRGAPRGGGGDRGGGFDRPPRDGGRGGGPGGPSGSSGRQGDWRCPNESCNNNNFAWRTNCNRCQTEKPGGLDDGGDSYGGRGGGGGGRYQSRDGPPMRGRGGGPIRGGRGGFGDRDRSGPPGRGGFSGGPGGMGASRPPRGGGGGSYRGNDRRPGPY